jgi:hypothetical protein
MESLRESIAVGNHEQFVALIEAKADSLYQEKHGYNAIINALKGQENSRLIEMLTLLVGSSVSLFERDYYYYGALAVYILSRIGSFDSVQLLLEAGANPDDITRAELMEAVEFGSLADVKRALCAAWIWKDETIGSKQHGLSPLKPEIFPKPSFFSIMAQMSMRVGGAANHHFFTPSKAVILRC